MILHKINNKKKLPRLCNKKIKVYEIGCGYGHIISDLNNEGEYCIGTDISLTVINRARSLHENCEFAAASFNDFEFYKSKNINVFLMDQFI